MSPSGKGHVLYQWPGDKAPCDIIKAIPSSECFAVLNYQMIYFTSKIVEMD